MGPRQCEICKDAQSKYKCPSCLVPYCSLTCFKRHKENPCNKDLPPNEELASKVLPGRAHQVGDPSCVVSEEQLKLLAVAFVQAAESSQIRDALKNVDLQKMIKNIDSCNNPADELDKAMEGHFFREFTDKILSIVSPQDKPSTEG